jgi:hypothetical protein
VTAFRKGGARNVEVIRRSDREWYFTFDVDNPETGETTTYVLWTQRGAPRLWADPRNMFRFLRRRFRVAKGTFQLSEKGGSGDGRRKGKDRQDRR